MPERKGLRPMAPRSGAYAPLRLACTAYHLLLVLAGGPNHGYGIAREVKRNSEGRTRPGTGSFYLSLAQLKDRGLIESCPAPDHLPVTDARRRYYRLTETGRDLVAAESDRLVRLLQVAHDRKLLSRQSIETLLDLTPSHAKVTTV